MRVIETVREFPSLKSCARKIIKSQNQRKGIILPEVEQ
jgi:hypothetical protein